MVEVEGRVELEFGLALLKGAAPYERELVLERHQQRAKVLLSV